ncbi:MAG: YecA family protein [Burkholderiaceae bacterium]
MVSAPPRRPSSASAAAAANALRPLSDAERDRLEQLLDDLPAPFEPLDICAVDGFLVGLLLQPQPVPASRWQSRIFDGDGRPLPAGLDVRPATELLLRRHAELEHALANRQWFDPWVFELDDAEPSEAVLPWVAGFAAALDQFGGLLALDDARLSEPLATLYAHFDPEDLDDVADLQDLIDEIEPPETLADAVEDLVRCSLLLADVSRPQRPAGAPQRKRARS